MKFILRDEARATERRTPLTPKNAKSMLRSGFEIAVEQQQANISR